jgi:hypothetical protein
VVEETEFVMPIPELPCCHPCSPLQHSGFMGMNLVWDEAAFAPQSGGACVPTQSVGTRDPNPAEPELPVTILPLVEGTKEGSP